MKKAFTTPELLTFFISQDDTGVFNKEQLIADVTKWIDSVSPDIWSDPTLEIEVEIIDGEINDE